MMSSVLLRSTARKLAKGWGFRSFQYFRQIPREDRLIPRRNAVSKICDTKMTVQVSTVNYSDQSDNKLSWKRTEGPPRIWHTFEGRRTSEDGTIPRFSIQDIPEDRVEDVLDFMLEYLLKEEAFCIALGIAKDPLAVEELRVYWRKMIRQGISIIVLAESSDPGKKPAIAGANILVVVTAQDKAKLRSLEQFKSKPLKTFFGLVFDAEDEADVLQKYDVDKYLGSIGLIVHPFFRGNGIGEKLLKVREDIGRAYEISVSEATFTMKASQISASRAGFELHHRKEYSEMLDYEGNLVFPGATGNFIHVMTKRLY